MSREVHVRFWESAGLRCPAPLNYIRAYETVAEARASIGRYLAFYNERRPHSQHGGRTPDQVWSASVSLIQVAA
jgi:hypothetical protein